MTFFTHVKALSNVIEEMRNPFILDTRDLTDPTVVDTVRKIERLGREQYETFVSEHLVDQVRSIKRNNLPLLCRPPVREGELQHANRVDLVWDEYIPGILKTYTRSIRGKGSRSALPRNWQEFLRNNDNKIELFSFLSKQVAALETDRQVIATDPINVLCTKPRDITSLGPCTQEEADTRVFRHHLIQDVYYLSK
ncbi:hypothetical protein Hamer_G023013, partial [Homarus americanus]